MGPTIRSNGRTTVRPLHALNAGSGGAAAHRPGHRRPELQSPTTSQPTSDFGQVLSRRQCGIQVESYRPCSWCGALEGRAPCRCGLLRGAALWIMDAGPARGGLACPRTDALRHARRVSVDEHAETPPSPSSAVAAPRPAYPFASSSARFFTTSGPHIRPPATPVDASPSRCPRLL